MLSDSDTDRFWSKVEKGNGCWIWKGCFYPHGYGAFHVAYAGRWTKRLAHRISWAIANGAEELPDSKILVCHSCDNRACVKPDHLWLGTHADNSRDMVSKGRHVGCKLPESIRRGELHGMSKLTDKAVREIRASYNPRRKSGFTSRALAKKYKVDASTILDVVHRRIWSHVAA